MHNGKTATILDYMTTTRIKNYIIPSFVSLLLFIIIIRPGFFNMIPYFIHQNIFKGIINESTFIYSFDFVFCLFVWYLVYRITKKN